MSNLIGTVNLMEAARHTKTVEAIVNITTDKCYDNQEWIWPYREEDRLGGHDPYSSSKACVEIAADAYRKSFLAQAGIQLANARAGNVIGVAFDVDAGKIWFSKDGTYEHSGDPANGTNQSTGSTNDLSELGIVFKVRPMLVVMVRSLRSL